MWPVVLGILGGSVAAFGIGGALRKRTFEKNRGKLLAAGVSLSKALKVPGFKIPSLKMKKERTFAERLDENLRAYFALSEILAVEYKANTYAFSVERPASSYPAGTMGRKNGPSQPGLLYSSLPSFLTPTQKVDPLYALQMWDNHPAITMLRARALLDRAIADAKYYEKHNGPIALGDGGNGPSIGELVEDYAQDAAVTYLASAIPGGALVVGVASALGIGWTNTSGRQEVPAGADIPADRYAALEGAAVLITYAYANPAPASAYPTGKLPR